MSRVLAILVVDHGSRNDEANRQTQVIAERIAERRPDWIVRHAHMEIAAPDIADGLAACALAGATDVIVHPHFLGPGRHIRETIPALVEAAAQRHPTLAVRIGDPLGVHDGLIDLVIERIEKV